MRTPTRCGALLLLALSTPVHAQDLALGTTCTYTKPSDPGRDRERAYPVQVVAHLEHSPDAQGRPWLWVKRLGDARYQSFITPASNLSECQR